MNKLQAPVNQERINRIVGMYNMIPNLLWSVINVTPIFIFCYQNMPLRLLYFFSGLSLLTTLLPQTFFNSIQLGKSTAAYKKIGIKFLNKFTQNGEFIKKLIRKKLPGYNVIANRHFSHRKLLKQTYMFERFHFALFSLFFLTMIFALLNGYVVWALIICVTNLLYNVYPNLLQQYIRIRLTSFNTKRRQVANSA